MPDLSGLSILRRLKVFTSYRSALTGAGWRPLLSGPEEMFTLLIGKVGGTWGCIDPVGVSTRWELTKEAPPTESRFKQILDASTAY